MQFYILNFLKSTKPIVPIFWKGQLCTKGQGFKKSFSLFYITFLGKKNLMHVYDVHEVLYQNVIYMASWVGVQIMGGAKVAI